MPQTKDGLEHLGHLRNVVLARHVVETRARRAQLGREAERLVDGEGGEVHVVLRAVLHVAAVALLDLRGLERVVAHVALDGVVLLPLVRENLEQGTAPGPGPPENHCEV